MELQSALVLCFLCHVILLIFAQDKIVPQVDLKQGRVSGVTKKSTGGRSYDAFMGIPFGRVPGRFMPPEPAGPFPDNFIADKKMVFCHQYVGFMGIETTGTEDCLILNIFRPTTPRIDTKLPVMVFIYGGAFVGGTSSPVLYGPQHFMDLDIILISINYRVGVLGFLSTGDSASPGNYGLLDQTLALQWVQDNVAAFGGDENKVAIIGQSAGGASVIFHLLSPLSAGLFHNAIAMSGSPLCSWALDSNPLKTAKGVGDHVKCPPTDDTEELVECLRQANATELAMASYIAWDRLAPVVEPTNGGRFLTEHPYKLMEEGRFNKVPVMIGTTLDEYSLFYSTMKEMFHVSEETFYNVEVTKMFGAMLDEEFVETDMEEIFTLAKEYFKDVDFDNTTALDIVGVQIASDGVFIGCVDLTIKFLTKAVPTYSYIFEYVSPVTKPTHFSGKPDVCHGCDMSFIFDLKLLNEGRQYSSKDKEMIKIMTELWTNFVYYSNPTPSGPLQWDAASPDVETQSLHLGEVIEMGGYRDPHKIEMWRNLYTNYMLYHITNE